MSCVTDIYIWLQVNILILIPNLPHDMILLISVLCLIFCASGAIIQDKHKAKSLVSLISHDGESTAKSCCSDSSLLSCDPVMVDPELLLSQKNINILGTELTFSSRVEPHGLVYHNSLGDEAVISFNKETGNMFGSLNTHDNKVFAIEKCEKSHVIKQYDVTKFVDEKEVAPPVELSLADRQDTEEVFQDNTTVVTYTVMMYVTKSILELKPNIEEWLDELFAVTNQGYVNSKIPLRVKKFCTEEAEIFDEKEKDMGEILKEFGEMKGDRFGDPKNLRNTADVAHLVVRGSVNEYECGIAYYLNDYRAGNTVSVSKMSCSIGYFSFGHEIAHHLGAHHNRGPHVHHAHYQYGFGYLIERVRLSYLC